jgi:hypothetical protein
MDKRNDLHKPLKIKFVSSGEEGLDQGMCTRFAS